MSKTTSIKPKPRSTKVGRFLQEAGVGFWLLIVLCIIVGFIFIFDIEKLASQAVIQYGAIGIFVFAVAADLLILPVGADVPLILALLLPNLNNISALLLVLSASYLSLFIAYHIGKTIGLEGLESIVHKKFINKILSMKTYEKWAMFISSLTPLPYIPYLAGVFNFSMWDTIKFIALPRTLRYLIVFGLTLLIGSEMLNFI